VSAGSVIGRVYSHTNTYVHVRCGPLWLRCGSVVSVVVCCGN